MAALQKKLEEQQKIIEFLASKYQKDTGRRLEMPTTLGQLLGDESIIEDPKSTQADKIAQEELSKMSFAEAVERLKLPKASDILQPKKGSSASNKKKDFKFTPEQLTLEKIDLSGFRLKRFSRAALRELVDGVALLPAIRSVILQDNGLTDECESEILDLISLPMVKCVDLSRNNISEKMATAIGKLMRDQVQHVQWIDLSQNDFFADNQSNSVIIQGLKKQLKLVYAGLSLSSNLHPNLIDQFVKLLGPKKPPFNLNLRNSFLTKQAGDYICKSLNSQDFYLTSLNLKFCYLSFEQIQQLSNALRFNKTLVKLDLSSNALKPIVASYLLDALLDNMCLAEVNFSNNFLDDEFAVDLSMLLEDNPILYKVDISRNPIGPQGGQALLNVLLMKNETLGSLGNIEENMYLGVRLREEIRQVLSINNAGADKRSAHIKDKKEDAKKQFVVEKEGEDPRVKAEFGGAAARKDANKVVPSKQMHYPLLKPVTFTNVMEDDYLSLGVWSLK